jgi:hypothetical protein
MSKSTIEGQEEKIRANRLRRKATYRGLTLVKTNVKDHRKLGNGYWVLDPVNRTLVGVGNLDQIEALLDQGGE